MSEIEKKTQKREVLDEEQVDQVTGGSNTPVCTVNCEFTGDPNERAGGLVR